MSNRDLLQDPCWSSKDLGQALPNSPHAVSVALPKWRDVIAYEENDPLCHKSLKAIYPRFGLNPLVSAITKQALNKSSLTNCNAWPYPNIATAKKAEQFCLKTGKGGKTIIKNVSGLFCLLTDSKATPSAKSFWQHTGLGASSRQAAIALEIEKKPSTSEAKIANSILLSRLVEIYSCPKEFIQLHPSGMAALYTALYAINSLYPKRPVLQIGFPYVDVLKLPQVIFSGSDLLINTDNENIEKALEERNPAAVIVELPSNPMLQCIDLTTIAKLAHSRGIPVIADDTIGSALNIDVLHYVDIIFSSLTKSFAGRGDILAGSLVISPYSQWAKELLQACTIGYLAPLSDPDAIALEEASRDVKQRIPKLNKSCIALKKKLEIHPAIARVLHPARCSNFQKIMRPKAGYGCLLSFELIEGLEKAQRFYDNLQVNKGPSLGTNFTLVCPYVLLAHYKELDWAEKCGVPAHLIRVSVGLENIDSLWERFEIALQA